MIITQLNQSDHSSVTIYNWLKHYNRNEKILINSSTTKIRNLSLNISSDNNKPLNINGTTLKNIDFYFNYRGVFKSELDLNFNAVEKESFDWFDKEEYKVFEYLEHFYSKSKWLGSMIRERNNNKLINLSIASVVGLDIPNTLVTTDKKELLFFLEQNSNGIIVKPISDHEVIKAKSNLIFIPTGTQIIDINKTHDIADIFFPTLFQEKVNKEFEIRSFYFNDQFYSMAIFSQNNEKTKIDFRNYDSELPNRCVPFQLPFEIEKKLRSFCRMSNYDMGSIDLLYTEENRFYFLEINYHGIFEWVSENCNYNIEQKIAKYIYDSSKNES